MHALFSACSSPVRSEMNMPSLLRRHGLPVAAILLLATSVPACTSSCPARDNSIWVGNAYTTDAFGPDPRAYDKPANAWVDNPRMAAFLADFIARDGVKWLSVRHGFECAPKPGGDCSDCFVCTLSRGDVIGRGCRPDGDLFVKAEIGPGASVRAMTYWRR
jgi:hypothetical protein